MTNQRRKRSTLEMGHDAFLDIVANLVGIMIILVVVLGMQTQSSVPESDKTQESATDDQLARLAQQRFRAASAQRDSVRFEAIVRRNRSEIQRTRQMRDRLLDLLNVARETWQQKKAEFDSEAVAAAERASKAGRLREQIRLVHGKHEALAGQPRPVHAVAHLPTPMAKTVFGTEIHLRLQADRLAVVPLDRLGEEIITNVRRALNGSREGKHVDAAGPVRGFVARYEMAKYKSLVNRGGEVAMTNRADLLKATIEPLEENPGQPIADVLRGRSELEIELAGRAPETTTVTVWVYPESYAAFRRLKEFLYARGYATAGRPLASGTHITVSPNGTRSTAQ